MSWQCQDSAGQCATPTYYSYFGEDLVIVFGQFLDKKDRLDYPIGHCKLLIFRFLTFLNLLILLLIEEEIVL